jgi:hypothetical protein
MFNHRPVITSDFETISRFPQNQTELFFMYPKGTFPICEASLVSSKTDFVRDTFMTTILGCLITEEVTTIFTAGDGVLVVNEEIEVINQQNVPHYVAHHLYKGITYPFQVRTYASKHIKRILLASDGIEELWGEEKSPAAVIDALFTEDAFFDNEIKLSKYLVEQPNLLDDTTIVLMKR